MTRFKYYSNYLACLLGTLIAVCGSFYITRDTMKIWLKLQTKSQKVQH